MEEDVSVPASSENPTAPSATPALGAPTTGQGPQGIGASALAAALGNIMGGASAGAPAGMHMAGVSIPSGPPLAEVLKAERILPLLQNPALVERLAPYLPEEHRSAEAMAQIVNAPQFKHQLAVLTQALETGQVDTSHFGLGQPAFGVTEFLKAIQREAGKDGATEGRGGAEDMEREQNGGSGNN